MIELTERRRNGQDLAHKKGKGELHTLYISPLKALATDIRRNLEMPIAEMQLPVRAESRTGDTPQSRRLRQRERPPDLLMTTPESLALLLSYPDAAQFFASLKCLIVDELHSFATSKRGHHLALCLARAGLAGAPCALRRPVGHGRQSARAGGLPRRQGRGRDRAAASPARSRW